MFGQPTVADATLQIWLDLLSQAEPTTQVQEIVVAGPLTQDPSNHYKTVRLAAVAVASP
jgi:hypothetical protein